MNILVDLFLTFAKIGCFTFGGGYAMLSMIQGEVVNRYGWISASEFTDIVAVSQMTPGPIGINSATYVGYSAVVSAGYAPWVGIAGAAVATLAVVMPSFLIMLALSRLLLRYMNHPTVKSIFATLRPAVVGLLASAALLLMNTENFGSPDTSSMQFGISLLLFAASFIAVWKFKVSPILLIILCGAIGGIIYSI